MSIKDINKKIIRLGDSLVAKIKYGFNSSYCKYDFLKTQYQKEKLLEHKIYKSIYNIK